MTVEVERVYEVDVPVEAVWERLSDPGFRARAISIVDSFEVDGDETVWRVRVPIPGIRGTVPVRTRDVDRDPPRYVKFVGDARVMSVQGEHELSATEDGTQVRNRFVVDGSIPGIERFFSSRIDDEIEGMLAAVGTDITVRRVE